MSRQKNDKTRTNKKSEKQGPTFSYKSSYNVIIDVELFLVAIILRGKAIH